VKQVLVLVLALLLIGCTSQSSGVRPAATSLPSTAGEAQDTLINFLNLLHTKNYSDAVPLFGGDYEQLQGFTPDIDANDHLALWTWACDNQLLRCLEVRSATFEQQVGDSYVFQVEFSNPDGSLFVLGPCCGANETEMPPVSQFEFTVTRNTDGKFIVMNAPPYVP
jgi:hypothetical protein